MAPKLSSPLEIPLSASPSHDENEDEVVSDEEEVEEEQQVKPSSVLKPVTSESGDEEEDAVPLILPTPPPETKQVELVNKEVANNGKRKRATNEGDKKAEKGKKRGEKDVESLVEDEEASLYVTELLKKGGLSEVMIRKGLKLMGKEKRDEMEKAWEKLLHEEAVLNLRYLELEREKMELALDGVEAAGWH